MNVKAQLTALKKESNNLPPAARVELSCRVAKQLEKAGKYEAAYEALSDFWPDRNSAPAISELDDLQRAEVLMRIGAIAGWLGSTDQIANGQEKAKDLLTTSVEIFEQMGKSAKEAEARGDLALCYWREG